MIKRWWVPGLVLMGLAGAVRPVAAQSGPAGEIVSLVNGLRAAEGVPPYTVDPALIASAQRQADWNAANGFSSHTGEGGTTPNDRALAAGYGGGLREWATENTAQGTLPYVNPQWVVTLWQGDAVHLRAMLSPDFENVGVGYAEANGEAFYTLVAGWVADEPPPPTVAPAPADAAEAESAGEAVPAEPAPPPFVLATPRPDGSIVHTVQEGQSFWVIAAYYDLDVETLLALNGLNENVFLHAGDELVIRPAEEPPAVAEAAAGATATPLAAPSPLALATPLPRLTPLATSVPTDADPPSEQGTKGGGFRRVATGAVIGLAVVGAGLVAWGLRRRPGDA